MITLDGLFYWTGVVTWVVIGLAGVLICVLRYVIHDEENNRPMIQNFGEWEAKRRHTPNHKSLW